MIPDNLSRTSSFSSNSSTSSSSSTSVSNLRLLKDEDIKAIEALSLEGKDHKFLKVVGKGDNQHLEAVSKNWFGRLWMQLGFGSSATSKIVKYILSLRVNPEHSNNSINITDTNSETQERVNKLLRQLGILSNEFHKKESGSNSIKSDSINKAYAAFLYDPDSDIEEDFIDESPEDFK